MGVVVVLGAEQNTVCWVLVDTAPSRALASPRPVCGLVMGSRCFSCLLFRRQRRPLIIVPLCQAASMLELSQSSRIPGFDHKLQKSCRMNSKCV